METPQAPGSSETTIMSVWPSISARPSGQLLGRLYDLGPRASVLGIPFRPGWLIALMSAPLALLLYFNKIVPRIPLVLFGFSNPWCRRYRLTTRRIVIEHPFDTLSQSRAEGAVEHGLALGEFDAIDVERQPGQEWFRAADLVFRRGEGDVLRLPGVPHAESFRQTCLKANRSHVAVRAIHERSAAAEPHA